jgi:hypothetical protein
MANLNIGPEEGVSRGSADWLGEAKAIPQPIAESC